MKRKEKKRKEKEKEKILYIKVTMSVRLSVWAVPGKFFQLLPVPCGAGDKQGRGRAGRPGQPLWGAARGAISIKEILGENRGTCI
jgi:hypothetical protein